MASPGCHGSDWPSCRAGNVFSAPNTCVHGFTSANPPFHTKHSVECYVLSIHMESAQLKETLLACAAERGVVMRVLPGVRWIVRHVTLLCTRTWARFVHVTDITSHTRWYCRRAFAAQWVAGLERTTRFALDTDSSGNVRVRRKRLENLMCDRLCFNVRHFARSVWVCWLRLQHQRCLAQIRK
jgi:hypothetical protein